MSASPVKTVDMSFLTEIAAGNLGRLERLTNEISQRVLNPVEPKAETTKPALAAHEDVRVATAE